MSQDLSGNWPPPYRIQENPRAQRVILRVRPQTGLLITVPRGFDPKGLPEILERHRPWIEERLEEALTKRVDPAAADLLPATIHLAATGETWSVTYHEKPAAGLELTWRAGPRPCLEMRGDVSRVPQCCRLLRLWVQRQAKGLLKPWVERLSRETALSYQKVTIRAQKTRWGSYSSRGTVSLNAALLFLPPRLVRLVILHELCHSRHERHDAAFGAFWHPTNRSVAVWMLNCAPKPVPFPAGTPHPFTKLVEAPMTEGLGTPEGQRGPCRLGSR